jgi:hypothetical protein
MMNPDPYALPETLKVEVKATSLEFLQAVYRNASLALPVRMRAAIAALPFELPKLAVTAVINQQSFAEVLDRRLQNMERISNGNAKMIEAKQVETKTPMPRLADRRYRRV